MNTSEQPSSPTRHSCVDCGTQNCKYQNRTYPEFCPTTHLKEEDLQWALERYDEPRNHDIMVASAEVEYEGYCQWTRVQEIMEFARKIGARKIGIAHCIGLIREAHLCPHPASQRLRTAGGDLQGGGQGEIVHRHPAGVRNHRSGHVQPHPASPPAERGADGPERGHRPLRGARQPVLQVLRGLRHHPRHQGPRDGQQPRRRALHGGVVLSEEVRLEGVKAADFPFRQRMCTHHQ